MTLVRQFWKMVGDEIGMEFSQDNEDQVWKEKVRETDQVKDIRKVWEISQAREGMAYNRDGTQKREERQAWGHRRARETSVV